MSNPRLEKFLSVIDNRKSMLEKAVLYIALVKNESNIWVVSYGLLTFIGKGDPVASDQKLDYGNFVLIKKFMAIPEAINLMHSVFEKNLLKIDDYPEIPIKVPFYETISIPSQGYYQSSLQYPMILASHSIDSNTTRQLPYDALSKIGLPLYPNGSEAVTTFFGLKRSRDWQNLSRNFDIIVPDFRARITSLRISGNRITVKVETKALRESALRAKFFCRNENHTYTSEDLPFEKGQATFITEEASFIIEAHILSIIDGETIDHKGFDYRYPSRENDVVVENDETQLVDMISKGENETVEFKVILPKDRKDLLESIVAFANTKGGTIFIGVDDNCGIKDFREDVKAQIVDLIQGNCEPTIEVHIRPATLAGDHQILIIEVPEGANKPYMLNNRGIFVRRGSSDRQIKRMELDDLYAKRNQGVSRQILE